MDISIKNIIANASEQELQEMNATISWKLKDIRRIREKQIAAILKVGSTVRFDGWRGPIKGRINELNEEVATVFDNNGETWKVPLTLLQKVG